ncbi:hypothetical protein NQD34_013703 [Periophthalmus magnuspinnatus]|uniref:uncharacterized protein LOC117386472 n=1 Tax=Periophthalmus magnuspinnatus TaxID=409849 RepID=UPI00145A9A69|nr:uncharacterized protein LOC117386472 [Periophthalmus magnuspinnatus]KAJ0006430.1 hypothetical protein NQD34_013703 [Periophthalmus magnuspinnatus]
MKLLLSSLQLFSLCALSSWSVSSQLVVIQSGNVTVEEGGTANISCCWIVKHESTRVIWKANNQVKNEKLSDVSCSYLTITNITEDHKGTYFCDVTVEIPHLLTGSGNGTDIKVVSINATTKNNGAHPGNNTSLPFSIIIGLAVVAPILLAAVCYLRRRQVQAVRVIYEVPHFDSETQEMDKHSTGSRDSSQWCQVPVYESFDYFEHTEAKKSG